MITNKIEEVKHTLEDVLLKEDIYTNLGKTERILSMIGGAYVLFKGIKNVFSSPLIATTELVIGFTLLQRGVSGHCNISERLENEVKGPEPILVIDQSIR